MALKKSDLYSSLWKTCDALRGGMDASQYKDYVLTLLFVKYVSDKYAGRTDSLVVIPEGGGFADLVAAKGKADMGDRVNKIIAKLAEANGLKGVIDITDFNDDEKVGKGKDMVDRLSGLVGVFENPALNFSRNRSDDDDLLGDAYEYLMRHFATESGKSKGQFLTPAEVSRIMAMIIGVQRATRADQSVYDPTSGSASLLLKVAAAAPVNLSLYGQEVDNATKALAVMNMWLHGHPTAEIVKGNTLADPLFKDGPTQLKQFDFVVSNPPFSLKNWRSGFDPDNDLFGRFDGFGTPPPKNGDYAFLLHILKSLKSTGTAAVILPHGVLFRGNAEAAIRQNLIERRLIKGIIGLPANLFYGTGIPACLIVLDKHQADSRTGIFLVDASKGYMKDGPKNRLREQDIHRITDVFNGLLEVPGYSRMVPFAEIARNGYNLNIPRYIDSQEREDIQDLGAHLLGGIPERDVDALEAYWKVYPKLRHSLFSPLRPGYLQLAIPATEVRATVFGHPEFTAQAAKLDALLATWKQQWRPRLLEVGPGTVPRSFIVELSEALLRSFKTQPLVDPYAMYQHLMDYWATTLKDDVYMLVEDGWKAVAEPVRDKNGKVKRDAYTCDLVPLPLLVARHFVTEQAHLIQLQAAHEALAQQVEELVEEHSGDEGALAPAVNEKGKVTKATLTALHKELKEDRESAEEAKLVKHLLNLMDEEARAKKAAKEAEEELEAAAWKCYATLTPAEVQQLVVDDKWLADLQRSLTTELDGISQRLAGRITELAERYASTLPALDREVETLGAKVEAHLKHMELQWN
jgi:type I restriction enzyme M protein